MHVEIQLLRNLTEWMKGQEMKHVVMKLDLFSNVFKEVCIQEGLPLSCTVVLLHILAFPCSLKFERLMGRSNVSSD